MTKNQERKAVVLPQIITETVLSRCSSRISSDEECTTEVIEQHYENNDVEKNHNGHLKLPVLVWPKEEAIPRRNSEPNAIKLSPSDTDHQEIIKTNSESFREELKALKEDLKQLGTYRSPPASSLLMETDNNGQFSQDAYDGQKASEKYQEELRALKENMRQLVAELRDVILEARIRDEEAKKQANEEKKAARNAAKLAERIEPPSANFSKAARSLISSKRLLKTDRGSKSESVLTNTTDKDKKDSDEESVTSSLSTEDIEQDHGKTISARTKVPNIGGNEIQGQTLKDIANEVGMIVNNRTSGNILRPISEETSDGTLSKEKTRNSARSRKTSPTNKQNVKAGNNEGTSTQVANNEGTNLVKNVSGEESKDFRNDKTKQEKTSPNSLTNNVAHASEENNRQHKNELNSEDHNNVTDKKISSEDIIQEPTKAEKNLKVPNSQNTLHATNLSAINQTVVVMKTERNADEGICTETENREKMKNGNNVMNERNNTNENHQIIESKQVEGSNQINGNTQVNAITSEEVDFFQSQRLRRESNREIFDHRLSDLDSISSIADRTIATSRRSSDAGLPGIRPGKDKKWYLNRYRVPKVPMEIALQLHKLGFEFESNRIRNMYIELQACENNLKKAIAQEKRDVIEERKRIEREAREKERREAQRRRMEELETREAKRKEQEAIEREKRRTAAIERRKHNLELLKNINNTILQTKASRSFRFSYFPFLPKPKRHFLTPSPELTEDDSDESGSEVSEDEEPRKCTPVSRVSCHSTRQKITSRK